MFVYKNQARKCCINTKVIYSHVSCDFISQNDKNLLIYMKCIINIQIHKHGCRDSLYFNSIVRRMSGG